jgi:tRNA pseudouridine(38-40) synthase
MNASVSTSSFSTSSEINLSEKPQRIALVIQYLGTCFHGWQRQLNQRTVQEEIEQAIESVLGYHVTLHAAGRTDAGAVSYTHLTLPTKA